MMNTCTSIDAASAAVRRASILKKQVMRLLSARTPHALERIYVVADRMRRHYMGDAVYARGIIEFSNLCANDCLYCGLRRSNTGVRRYKMTTDEILAAAEHVKQCGQTTVVLQSGETPDFGDERLGELIRRIKRRTGLAITVSAGNRPAATYRFWRACGMDRYLLRFETSDGAAFAKLHPDCTLDQRLRCLRDLRAAGVQVGSGFMIGLPGETPEILAGNILLCRELELDMIGIGPFIPHPDTPLGNCVNPYDGWPEMFFLALAVLRIVNPRAHIPATTAYDAVFPGTGRNLALQRGANVFMPNNTPAPYRQDYLIYPGKPCLQEDAGMCAQCLVRRLEKLGRPLGVGPGHALRLTQNAHPPPRHKPSADGV